MEKTRARRYVSYMTNPAADDDFTPQEAQERYERALRAGLNMKPVPNPAKKDQPKNDETPPKRGRSHSKGNRISK